MQVTVNISAKHQQAIRFFRRSAVFEMDKQSTVKMHCNVVVASLAMDSVEASMMLCQMQRYHCCVSTLESKSFPGCCLCLTCPFDYGSRSSDLPAKDAPLRDPNEMEKNRPNASERKRLGTTPFAPSIDE